MNVKKVVSEPCPMKKLLEIRTPYQCRYPTLVYERPHLSTAVDYDRLDPIPYEHLTQDGVLSKNPTAVTEYLWSTFKGMRYFLREFQNGSGCYVWRTPASQEIMDDVRLGPANRIVAISVHTSHWKYMEVAPRYRRKGYAHMMLKSFPGIYSAMVSCVDLVGFYLLMTHCFVPVRKVLTEGDIPHLIMNYTGFDPVRSFMSDLAFLLRGRHEWSIDASPEEWENMMDRLLAFYEKYGPDIPTPVLASPLALNSNRFDDLIPIEQAREGNYHFSHLERWDTPIWWPYSLEKWKRFYDRHFATTISGGPQFFLNDYTEKPDWFSGTDEQWFAIAAHIDEMHDDILADIQTRPQYL